MKNSDFDDVPVVHKALAPDGVTTQQFIALADYGALVEAVVDFCKRVSALDGVAFPAGPGSVLRLLRDAQVTPPLCAYCGVDRAHCPRPDDCLSSGYQPRKTGEGELVTPPRKP